VAGTVDRPWPVQPATLFFDASAQSVSVDPTPADAIFQQNLMEDIQLPSNGLLEELMKLFFENLGHVFPCFHRTSFEAEVQNGKMQKTSPMTLYALCCVAARYHSDPRVRSRQQDWYEQAKLCYELTQRAPCPGLRTLQAALILVFHGYSAGDFSISWLFLGKAWRQAVTLGMNRMDASLMTSSTVRFQDAKLGPKSTYHLESHEGTTVMETEESRRTLWMLLIMDRNHTWPTGYPTAIPEMHFKVDLPIADTLFQSMDHNTTVGPGGSIPFTRDLGRLVASMRIAQDTVDVFAYVCVAYVLLGRIADLIHSLHAAPDSTEYAVECEELDAHLIKLRLSLTRFASSVLEARPSERAHVVWLQVTLNTCAMILHFHCASGVAVNNASSQFKMAVTAARNIAQIVKDASRISLHLLLSVHIASPMYVSAYLLVVEWRLTNDASIKEEIDLLALVFDRMNEVYAFLGLKYKFALEHDIRRSKKSLEDVRDRGLKGLLADCSKWTHVKDEVERRGIPITIT
jgi:hypothetical protein